MITDRGEPVAELKPLHSAAGEDANLDCLYLQRQLNRPVPFVVFDHRLAEAARAEGVTVVSTSSTRGNGRRHNG